MHLGAFLVVVAYLLVLVSGILIVVNAFNIESARKKNETDSLNKFLDSNIIFGYILMSALVLMLIFNMYAMAIGSRTRFGYGPTAYRTDGRMI